MLFEKATPEIVRNVYKNTKLQTLLNQFRDSDDPVVHCVLEQGEYSSIRSAQSSIHNTIKRLRYPMVVRTIHGELYLIKTITKEVSV